MNKGSLCFSPTFMKNLGLRHSRRRCFRRFGLLSTLGGLGATFPVCPPKNLTALGSPVAFAHVFRSEKDVV
jgi:hypothetical protein